MAVVKVAVVVMVVVVIQFLQGWNHGHHEGCPVCLFHQKSHLMLFAPSSTRGFDLLKIGQVLHYGSFKMLVKNPVIIFLKSMIRMSKTNNTSRLSNPRKRQK
jgi:hypothetical protein